MKSAFLVQEIIKYQQDEVNTELFLKIRATEGKQIPPETKIKGHSVQQLSPGPRSLELRHIHAHVLFISILFSSLSMFCLFLSYSFLFPDDDGDNGNSDDDGDNGNSDDDMFGTDLK